MIHPLRQYNLPRKRSFFQLLFLIFQWQISPLPESVASDHFRQVGSFSIAGESGTSVSKSTSIVISFSQHGSDEGHRQESLASRRGSHLET
jgi:hypothetical protein